MLNNEGHGRLWTHYALLFIPLALFAYGFLQPSGQADDAYISYRYAQNLADGHGLVFNLGERVEGYTNLLWTLLVALGIKVGVTAVVAGDILGLFTGLLCLIGTYCFATILLPHNRQIFAVLAPCVLLASNAFASWTQSGLETPMFSAWVIWAFVFFMLNRIWLVLAFCILALLTRPEGMLLAAVLLGAHWLRQVYVERPRALLHLITISLPALVFVSVVVAHTLFRVIYYNDWLPNTFRAKVGGIPLMQGVAYVYNFLVDGHGFLLPGTLLAAALIPRFRVPFIFIALVTLYVVAVGGDVFQFGRFFLPILPLLIGGALASVFVGMASKRSLLAAFLALTFALCPLWCLYAYWPTTADNGGVVRVSFPLSGKRIAAVAVHTAFGGDEQLKAQADRVLAIEPPVRLVATVGLGRLGYFLGTLPMLDLVGLVDRHIARSEKTVQGNVIILPGHQRTDANYVFGRNPDLIIIPRKEDGWLVNPAMRDLWDDPRFDQRYLWDADLQLYRRKSEMPQ